jgi:DNA replication and repair protein RecF
VHLTHLSLVDFRSYPALDLTLGPGVVTFVGANGQGKTNLLEAVGYLATLGSHRVANDAPLIRAGAERAVIRSRVVRGDRAAVLELEIVAGRANRVRLNRRPVARARDILGVLCTVLFAPEDLALVKGDPAERRRFLDELLVARAPRLAGVLADYERVLRQRSTLLRGAGMARRSGGRGDLRTLDAWDEQLARHGAELLAARLALVADLRPRIAAAYAAVAGTDDVSQAAGATAATSTAPVGPAPAPVAPAPGAGQAADPSTDGGAGQITAPPAAAATVATIAAAAGGSAASPAASPTAVPVLASSPSPTSPSPTSPTSSSVSPAAVDSTSGAGTTVDYRSSVPLPAGTPGTPGTTPGKDELAVAMLAELAAARPREIERGVTLVGPHRDELLLSISGRPARGYASHGESWSLALALRLASFELLRAEDREPVLLLDDVFAELDVHRRRRLAELVAPAEQVLVTAAVGADVPAELVGARFTVGSGEVRRVD